MISHFFASISTVGFATTHWPFRARQPAMPSRNILRQFSLRPAAGRTTSRIEMTMGGEPLALPLRDGQARTVARYARHNARRVNTWAP